MTLFHQSLLLSLLLNLAFSQSSSESNNILLKQKIFSNEHFSNEVITNQGSLTNEKHYPLLSDFNLEARYRNFSSNSLSILIVLSNQSLYVLSNCEIEYCFPISSSEYGAGNRRNSQQTPLGLHRIETKIGTNAAYGSIFRWRKNIHSVARIYTNEINVDDDIVTSRILWLAGMEPGVNKGRGIDSYKRYIYIHGTHEEGLIGKPASRGCIRMFNEDVIFLYDMVKVGTEVLIIQ